MSNTYTAIDFETAHGKRWSICQVGLVRVVNGEVTAQLSRLVCPPDNYYFYRNTEVHGIRAEHTLRSPCFSTLWSELRPFIHNQTVVAHNGAFDFSCLSQALDYYRLEQPDYNKMCTYKIFKKKLATLCMEHRIELKHHDALSDAMACAQLYQIHLSGRSVETLQPLHYTPALKVITKLVPEPSIV